MSNPDKFSAVVVDAYLDAPPGDEDVFVKTQVGLRTTKWIDGLCTCATIEPLFELTKTDAKKSE